MTSAPGVRAVVVEDSLVQKAHLVHVLEADGDITVVGEATSATEAAEVVQRLRPDVVTLDIHIPGGGISAIERIMAEAPVPILVLSAAVVDQSSTAAVEALVAGALEALPKPEQWGPAEEALLRERVRALRGVTVLRHPRGARTEYPSILENGMPVVALAASTGGPAALAEVLSGLGGLQAPVLVVQHLHPDFVSGFVTWMRRASALPVQLAAAGASLQKGSVYVAPGGTHLRIEGGRARLDPHPDTIHRPSADQLLHSVAEEAGSRGVGVVLTGMGDDGAAGLLELRRRGGFTAVQDEATCAVFGMPMAAQKLGAAMQVLPLQEIAAAVVRAAARRPR